MLLASAAGCSRGGLAEAVGPRDLRGLGVSAASESLSSSSLSWGGGGGRGAVLQQRTDRRGQSSADGGTDGDGQPAPVAVWLV